MSAEEARALAVLAAAWLAYCGVHSALASLAVKRWIERRARRFYPAYRLVYNLVAVALLLPVAALLAGQRGTPLWAWSGAWGGLADALAVGAVAAVVLVSRYYDGSDFLGLRSWARRHEAAAAAGGGVRLRLSPLHRYVRHPWYSAALVWVWTRDMDPARLLSALLISAYLVFGSRLEEAKLIIEFGEAYRRYRARVPGLVPLPWKTISAREAARIEAQARAAQPSSRV